jgi:alanine-glyoxylate transaminase/serine-glyoxylate transaminase/serine-pyruvate transaminase
MRAMAAPVLSHVDPDFFPMLDEVRASLRRLFKADDHALTLATSGTGTSAMETAVANAISPGMRALVVVTGYFGDRLVQIMERYGATVRRIDVEWGRACDPQRLRDELRRDGADVVGLVHAETSTGVRNPIKELAAIARAAGALTIVDTVTSLGGHEVDLAGWGVDIAYSCAQKCVGAPSGIAPIAISGPARRRLVPCRSFYFDLALLEDYWVNRKYHHTICSTMVYALAEALQMIDDEGLEARFTRHERHHRALVAGLTANRSRPAAARAGTAVDAERGRVPAGVDEAAVRKHAAHRVQYRGGCRPGSAGRKDLASRPDGGELHGTHGAAVPRRVRKRARAARPSRARRRGCCRRGSCVARTATGICWLKDVRCQRLRTDRARLSRAGRARVRRSRVRLSDAPDVRPLATTNPASTAFMELRAREAAAQGKRLRRVHAWIPYTRISQNLKRAVLVAEDDAFWEHEGIDVEQIRRSIEIDLEKGAAIRGASTITQQLAKNLYLSPSRNPLRKLRELIITRRLEAALPKARILELYLNLIEWGDGIWGAEQPRARISRRRRPRCSREQAALLAGAIVNPRVLNPARPTGRLVARQRPHSGTDGSVEPPRARADSVVTPDESSPQNRRPPETPLEQPPDQEGFPEPAAPDTRRAVATAVNAGNHA